MKMTRIFKPALLGLAAWMALAGGLNSASADPLLPSSKEAKPAQMTKEERLKWYREAKYGLFIHFGLYSLTAGEWKGQPVKGIGEWVMNRMQIPAKEYEQLANQFNPVNFDADAIVQLAKDAGMKYVVITSKHHDGFALFQSKVDKYNVVDGTPYKRDIIKELSEACARGGLRFGVYYSQSQDWHEPNGAGNTWDFGPDNKKDFDKYLQGKAEPQVRELMSNYGPMCLIWFDTPYMMNKERGTRLEQIVRTLQPACLIDGRLGTEGDYVSTGDNVIPGQATDQAWETPATVNHTWGYKKDDTDWKSPGDIVFKLVDIASKGGNYLLNIGPMGDGTVPPQCAENLRAAGQWIHANSEVIYGTGRTPFGEELGDYAATLKDRAGKPVYLNRTDWRCTTKPGKLFFTLFTQPREGFDLPKFKNKIKSVYLLSDAGKKQITMKTQANGVITVQTERPLPNAIANVIVVEIEGDKVEK